MKQADRARVRDAFKEWKTAGERLRLTGDPKPLMAFAERHGDFLQVLTQGARTADPRLNAVSMFDIISDMIKNSPQPKVIDSP